MIFEDKEEVILSKSFDFCKSVAQDALRSSYTDRSWDNAFEYAETEAIFDELLQGNRKLQVCGTTDEENKYCFNISISFDANADFDYFTSDSCIHDGTLYFIREAMNRCVQRVCLAQTYNKNVGKPRNGESIKYVIGNFVILNECDGDFVPVWATERTTVLLPLKMMKV